MMDERGMLPKGLKCQRCGKELDDGTRGYPAELYAGTYTGLCYACTGAGPYVVRVHVYDDAMVVSHPPACPSWRRDRTEHFAYADCDQCHGRGAFKRWGRNGHYMDYYKACLDRFMCPDRRERDSANRVLMKTYQRKFIAELRSIVQARQAVKLSGVKLDEAVDALCDDDVQPIRERFQAQYETERAEIEQKYAHLSETREPTDDERQLL